MVGNRVALARRAVAVERDGALPVEMRRGLVPVQVREDRCQRFASLKHVGRLTFLTLHIDGEARIDGEERLLACSVATVGAMGVRIEQLPNRETVGGLDGREYGVNVHRSSSLPWLRSRAIHSRIYRGQRSNSTPSPSCAARKRTTARSTSVASARSNASRGRYRCTCACSSPR